MIYARAHDQAVADDYFAAMQRIEQRLEIVPPESTKGQKYEIVKVKARTQVLGWVEQLARPELYFEERLGIAAQVRELLGVEQAHPPPVMS